MIPFPITFWAQPDGGIVTTLPLASVHASAPGLTPPVNISVDESLVLTDAIAKVAIDRTVVKSLVEFMTLAESIKLARPLPLVTEDLLIVDAISRVAISRTQIKTLVDTQNMSETITLIAPDPVISSCSNVTGDPGGACGTGRCCSHVTFDTGADCQSVQIQYSIDSGDWTAWQNMDVSPNTAGYNGSNKTVNEGSTIKWRVVPFSGDGQTGRQGTVCDTATNTCGDL